MNDAANYPICEQGIDGAVDLFFQRQQEQFYLQQQQHLQQQQQLLLLQQQQERREQEVSPANVFRMQRNQAQMDALTAQLNHSLSFEVNNNPQPQQPEVNMMEDDDLGGRQFPRQDLTLCEDDDEREAYFHSSPVHNNSKNNNSSSNSSDKRRTDPVYASMASHIQQHHQHHHHHDLVEQQRDFPHHRHNYPSQVMKRPDLLPRCQLKWI